MPQYFRYACYITDTRFLIMDSLAAFMVALLPSVTGNSTGQGWSNPRPPRADHQDARTAGRRQHGQWKGLCGHAVQGKQAQGSTVDGVDCHWSVSDANTIEYNCIETEPCIFVWMTHKGKTFTKYSLLTSLLCFILINYRIVFIKHSIFKNSAFKCNGVFLIGIRIHLVLY